MTELFKGKQGLANLFLRLGMAITLLLSLRQKFANTDKVVEGMNSLGLGFMTAGLVQALGVVLLAAAILLIVGYKVQYVGVFLTLFFLVTVLAGIPSAWTELGIWKDFALLGGAVALMLGGAGDYSVDNK